MFCQNLFAVNDTTVSRCAAWVTFKAKFMDAGMAAKNGLMAAILAGRGFTGRADIFDTDFLDNICTRKADIEKLLERLYGPLASMNFALNVI